MTLGEYMETVDPEQITAIGSKSQYVFIGTKEEFDRDIDEIAERLHKVAFARLASAIQRINEIKEGYSYKGGDLYDYASQLVHAGKSLRDFIRIKQEAQQAVNHFKPFQERKILEKYNMISEPTTVVKVEGYEQGSFWLRNEYVAARAAGKYTVIPEKEKEENEYSWNIED